MVSRFHIRAVHNEHDVELGLVISHDPTIRSRSLRTHANLDSRPAPPHIDPPSRNNKQTETIPYLIQPHHLALFQQRLSQRPTTRRRRHDSDRALSSRCATSAPSNRYLYGPKTKGPSAAAGEVSVGRDAAVELRAGRRRDEVLAGEAVVSEVSF